MTNSPLPLSFVFRSILTYLRRFGKLALIALPILAAIGRLILSSSFIILPTGSSLLTSPSCGDLAIPYNSQFPGDCSSPWMENLGTSPVTTTSRLRRLSLAMKRKNNNYKDIHCCRHGDPAVHTTLPPSNSKCLLPSAIPSYPPSRRPFSKTARRNSSVHPGCPRTTSANSMHSKPRTRVSLTL